MSLAPTFEPCDTAAACVARTREFLGGDPPNYLAGAHYGLRACELGDAEACFAGGMAAARLLRDPERDPASLRDVRQAMAALCRRGAAATVDDAVRVPSINACFAVGLIDAGIAMAEPDCVDRESPAACRALARHYRSVGDYALAGRYMPAKVKKAKMVPTVMPPPPEKIIHDDDLELTDVAGDVLDDMFADEEDPTGEGGASDFVAPLQGVLPPPSAPGPGARGTRSTAP